MPLQITIVGLGQIGASVGLALAGQKDKIQRVGHDKDPDAAKKAVKIGAVDKTSNNLFRSIEGADAVLLALPIDQIHETLSLIAGDVREDSVILDTAPIKTIVGQWAADLLPPQRHYVGLTPMINPHYLHGVEKGIDAAREDLFKDGLLAIVTPRESDSAAAKFAADLAYLIGATPLFVDAAEVDSFMASTHILPQLMAAALLGTTVDQPGWRDGGKFAGRAYAQVTSPVAFSDSPGAVVSEAFNNPENTRRVIDQMISYLQEIKESIEEGDSKRLLDGWTHLSQQRSRWLQMRFAADWEANPNVDEIPTRSDMLGQILLGRYPRKKRN